MDPQSIEGSGPTCEPKSGGIVRRARRKKSQRAGNVPHSSGSQRCPSTLLVARILPRRSLVRSVLLLPLRGSQSWERAKETLRSGTELWAARDRGAPRDGPCEERERVKVGQRWRQLKVQILQVWREMGLQQCGCTSEGRRPRRDVALAGRG